ncbi:MAG: Ultraviolet N-glycosylase/AP lyase [Syntrophus sp. PtaU1.Bin208]|nr:MAG: Ultraviolet N-glycosylase/AP lyase [Syntrophus sp. PtaU1.Bin208]
MTDASAISVIYDKLNSHFGDLHWWPAETAFEVIVGAILTQNTAWQNVERALDNLKAASLLEPQSLYEADSSLVEDLIRPAGYFRIKTSRVKNFLSFLHSHYGLDLERMFSEDLWQLRGKMLAVKGIGKETADSILLYAGSQPIFVIDAYTKRIFSRHGMIASDISYDALQAYIMRSLPPDVPLYNQYHALIVNAGKRYCRTVPRCDECPLKSVEYCR